jgi:hypothetical protein
MCAFVDLRGNKSPKLFNQKVSILSQNDPLHTEFMSILFALSRQLFN